MKKIFLVAAAFLSIFIFGAGISSAQGNLGIVIVGGAEFKTADYYKIVSQTFKLQENFKIGDEMQSKYQRFLMENDLLDEKIPRKQHLLDFTAQSGCEEILFLIIDSTADHQNNGKRRQKNRLSVQVDAYLCDSYKILEGATFVKDSKSKTSDLRARREAFKKCLTELAKVINVSA